MSERPAPQLMISVHGTELVPGSLTIESEGGLLSWHGTAERAVNPGHMVRLIIINNEAVYFGEALIKALTIPGPDETDQKPTIEYFGAGKLGRRTLTEVGEWLATTAEMGA